VEQQVLPAEAQAEVERLGSAEIVVGLVTAGPETVTTAVIEAIRAGAAAHFAQQSAAVVQVDPTSTEESGAPLREALGDLPLLRIVPSARATGRGSGREEGIRAVLEAGRQLGARAIIVLNPELTSTTAAWPGGLGGGILKEGWDLVLPAYQRSRYEGTLTHGLVGPVLRALFGRRLGHPLAEEFACSGAAASFFLAQDVWGTELGRNGLEFWLPAAAAAGELALGQAALGPRTVRPGVRPSPLGATVGRVAAALFALAERLEAAWIEVRGSAPVPTFGAPGERLPEGGAPDPERMLIGFRQGVRDLYPVWERILAPENLAEILVLSDAEEDRFRMPDRLWTRVVYDFLLAHRARVVYRSHVAQSLAPVYLGWATSLILQTRARPAAAVADAVERLGREFEEQKPYLIDRWR
jgi:glucosylglycerate synthase